MADTVKVEMRMERTLVAAFDAFAAGSGQTRSAATRVAWERLMDEGSWPVVGAGEPAPAMVANPALVGSSYTTAGAARRPARPAGAAVMAAASVVAPPVRTSPRLAGADPRDGCTHPPASVRTRGGIRSCGNCGTDLGLAKGGDAKT